MSTLQYSDVPLDQQMGDGELQRSISCYDRVDADVLEGSRRMTSMLALQQT